MSTKLLEVIMIRLRPYKACDAKYIAKWLQSEYEFRQWFADGYESYPITEEMINKRYMDSANSNTSWEMTAFNEVGILGHFIMRFTDKEMKTVRFEFVIIDNNLHGKGYGKEILEIAIKYSFEILKVEKITLGVFENNLSAYYCYKSAGFNTVKSVNEKYSILNEEWLSIEMELLKL